MPAVDLVQLVHSAVEKNSGIPAMLDAYSEFIDSPIGPLELKDLESIFSAVLANLSDRFPQMASQRAATNARNDIVSFLSASNNDVERVKGVLREKLRPFNRVMAASISERFSKMNNDERRAIDATLRLLKRSREDIIFKAERGKGIENSGKEFERFFLCVKAQSPLMKELRFQNLIVEKGIFNKLLLKSEGGKDNTIWVPSFFAKENVGFLIEKAGVASEHLLYSKLKEMKEQGTLDLIRPILQQFLDSQGVLTEQIKIPSELDDFVLKSEASYLVLSPLDIDDISTLFEEEIAQKKAHEQEEKAQREASEKSHLVELEKQKQQEKKKFTILVPETEQEKAQRDRAASQASIYIGKMLDEDQFLGSLNRRAQEKEIEAQVKNIGDYYVDLSEVKQSGVSIVGSSGSGRSTTLRRLLDGIASAIARSSEHSRVIVIDQKGEHRGIAWKFKWNVLAFVSDTQSKEFRLPGLFPKGHDENQSEVAAGILQEWLLQTGLTCSDQQRARIASIIRSQAEEPSGESIASALLNEQDLIQLGQKLKRNLLSKGSMSRIFAQDPQSKLDLGDGSLLFDVSGRGLRDPTTKEERLIASVLILKHLADLGVQSSIIVIEDILDRFKSENLRKRMVDYLTKLRDAGNAIISTSRSQVRDFVGSNPLEILHRLSGEKTIAEELGGFRTTHGIKNLGTLISFLPRGYAFTSSISTQSVTGESRKLPSAAIKVEPLLFSIAVT